MTCHIITRLGEQLGSGGNLSYEIFSDEEPLDLIAYQLNDRSFRPTFHSSKYNKKVFPGGFQPNVFRSKKTPHRDIDKSSRNRQLQQKFSNLPRQSYLSEHLSCSGLEDFHRGAHLRSMIRVTVSEPLAANPPPSGLLLHYRYTTTISQCSTSVFTLTYLPHQSSF